MMVSKIKLFRVKFKRIEYDYVDIRAETADDAKEEIEKISLEEEKYFENNEVDITFEFEEPEEIEDEKQNDDAEKDCDEG